MGWTNESVEELRRLWDKGLTASEIAKKLGVTKNAIVGKVHRLCLKARPSPIKTKEEEVELKHSESVQEEIVFVETEVVEETQIEDSVKEKIEEDLSIDSKGRVGLVDLDSHTCRWPLGDPRDDDFGFCGKKVRAGQTYCDEHSSIAYVKANRR
ncbi:MAG: global cell cycle regulator GcrA-like protein [Alphaproteobacteria bacterium]|nr:global cell cycle regulator GcrA-like protein [Alphaproteobacteria bacterium]